MIQDYRHRKELVSTATIMITTGDTHVSGLEPPPPHQVIHRKMKNSNVLVLIIQETLFCHPHSLKGVTGFKEGKAVKYM